MPYIIIIAFAYFLAYRLARARTVDEEREKAEMDEYKRRAG